MDAIARAAIAHLWFESIHPFEDGNGRTGRILNLLYLVERGLLDIPVLFLSLLWKDCTTRGATIGGFLGLITAVVLTVVSPSVWETTLGNPKGSALFPYASPALFSMAAGFIGIWLFSILDSSPRAKLDRAGYMAKKVRSETGIGASSASSH